MWPPKNDYLQVMSFMFLFYLQTLDSNIWTHRHQAVKAHVRRKTKYFLSALYEKCHLSSHCQHHLRRSKIPTAPDVYIDAINKKCNTKRITQLVCKLQEQIVRTKVTFIIRHIFSMPFHIKFCTRCLSKSDFNIFCVSNFYYRNSVALSIFF